MSQVMGVPLTFAGKGEYMPSYPGNARRASIYIDAEMKRYGKFVFELVGWCVHGDALVDVSSRLVRRVTLCVHSPIFQSFFSQIDVNLVQYATL